MTGCGCTFSHSPSNHPCEIRVVYDGKEGWVRMMMMRMGVGVTQDAVYAQQ